MKPYDRPLYFDRKGEPITLEEWVSRFKDMTYKRVAHHRFSNGWIVSTVWLGLDHGIGGPPEIFETALFRTASWGRRRGLPDFGMWRHSSEQGARDFHHAKAAEVFAKPRIPHQTDLRFRRKERRKHKAFQKYLKSRQWQKDLM